MNDKIPKLQTDNDQRSVQETLYLMSLSGTYESIKEGLATPLEECDEEPGW